MNMPFALIMLIAGLAILIKGADLLVDGAVAVAERFGVSPLVIGLTIVAMGTSAPEVATSIGAALKDAGDTAIGNVYGSNIANLALVGGLCALIRPIRIRLSALRREIPVMLIVALLLFPVLYDKTLGRIDSLILLVLFAGLICFTVITSIRQGKSMPGDVAAVDHQVQDMVGNKEVSFTKSVVFILLGLGGLALGAELMLTGAEFIGQSLGLSETVIGLTIVAVGTSLPELVTCLVAAFKGHDDLSIGNLVGSNVFNTLLVVGVAGLIKPFDINARLIGTDYWVMTGVTGVFVLIAVITHKIGRVAGTLLLAGYVSYITYVLVMTRGL